MKRGLVVSGGGAKIAWACGIIEYLIKNKNYKYDVLSGTSAGSLSLPLTALEDIESLKDFVLNVTVDSIYNVCPFDSDGKIKKLNAITRILRGKSSLGEAKNLFELIKKCLNPANYKAILMSNKDVLVTCVNYNTGRTKTVNIRDNKLSYDNFLKYMLASCSIPMIFDFVIIDGDKYLDGGVTESVPLNEVIALGCDEVDVIVLKPKIDDYNIDENWNLLEVAMRTLEIMNNEITHDDINIGTTHASIDKVKVNTYYTPRTLTNNSAMFNKQQMKYWWDEAYWSMIQGSNIQDTVMI